MGVLSAIAKNKGCYGAIEGNQIWESFRGKHPEEIIPHAQSILKETGNLNQVLSFFGGKN